MIFKNGGFLRHKWAQFCASITLAIACPVFSTAEPIYLYGRSGVDQGVLGLIMSNGLPSATADAMVVHHASSGWITSTHDDTASGPYLKVLRDVTLFGGTETEARTGTIALDPQTRVPFEWRSQILNLDDPQLLIQDHLFTVSGIERLSLINVDATIQPALSFAGTDQRLELHNASAIFSTPISVPTISGGTFTIDAVAGENLLTEFKPDLGQIDLQILVQNGASLIIEDAGDLRKTDRIFAFAQHPYAQSTVTIDGGTLTFQRSNVVFDHSNTTITNGGVLHLGASGSRVQLDHITLGDGTIKLDHGSPKLVAKTLEVVAAAPTTAIIDLDQTSEFQIEKITANGDLIITGNASLTNDTLQTQIIELAPNVRVEASGNHHIYTGFISLGTGAVFDITNSTNAQTEYFVGPARGGTLIGHVEISDNATLRLTGHMGQGSRIHVNVAANGFFIAQSNASLAIDDFGLSLNVDQTGAFYSNGLLDASGHITGDGDVIANAFSKLSIDNLGTIASLHSEPRLTISDAAELVFDLGVSNGAAVNDKIYYNHNPILIGRPKLTLHNATSSSADDFNNRQFTLMLSENAASTGSISYFYDNIQINPDTSMPAGLTYSIVDVRTNGHRDVTLETTFDYQAILHRTDSRNHRRVFETIINTASATPNITLTSGSTLSNALNSLTIGALATTSGTHLEGFASSQTVAIERQELLADLVMAPKTPCQSGATTWAQTSGANGRVDDQNDLGGYGYTISQVASGGYLTCTDQTGIGFYVGAGSSKLTEHGTVQHKISTDGVGAGVYVQHKLQSGAMLSAMAGIGANWERSERTIPDAGAFTGGTAKARFQSYSSQIGIRLEKTIPFDTAGVLLTPSVGVIHAIIQSKPATETGGGDFNYRLNTERTQALSIEPNVRLTKRGVNTADRPYALSAHIGLSHDVFAAKEDEHTISGTSATFGPVSQIGQARGATGATFGLSATAVLSKTMTFGGGISITSRAHSRETSAALSFIKRW